MDIIHLVTSEYKYGISPTTIQIGLRGACMAMLLHCSYEEAASYFKKDFETEDMNEQELCQGIRKCGRDVTIGRFDPIKESIVIVPSLNIQGSEHVVCWSKEDVLDSNEGRVRRFIQGICL